MLERTALCASPTPWNVRQERFDSAAAFLTLKHDLRNSCTVPAQLAESRRQLSLLGSSVSRALPVALSRKDSEQP